jgi:hypothetical protein
MPAHAFVEAILLCHVASEFRQGRAAIAVEGFMVAHTEYRWRWMAPWL